MGSRLRRRVQAIWRESGQDERAVLAAFRELRRTGRAPAGPAGEKAARCWEESAHLDKDPLLRILWCQLRITGMGLAEYLARAYEPPAG